MDRVVLVKPAAEHEQAVLDYRDEFLANHETIHGSGGLEKAASYEEWLRHCQDAEHEDRIPQDRVPASQYLGIRESDGRIVGVIQIRHRLNEHLKLEGGHIGYSVRRSERRKGYGTQMLHEALEQCKQLGIKSVLLTCEPGNTGSASVMKANGGVYEKQVVLPDNSRLDHYLVKPE